MKNVKILHNALVFHSKSEGFWGAFIFFKPLKMFLNRLKDIFYSINKKEMFFRQTVFLRHNLSWMEGAFVLQTFKYLSCMQDRLSDIFFTL